MDDRLRTTSLTMLAAAAAGAVAALVIRDQMARHSRNLFSPRFFRRLAALGHMARADASVDNVNLLKDFVTWEPRRSLRNRATAIIARMEQDAARSS